MRSVGGDDSRRPSTHQLQMRACALYASSLAVLLGYVLLNFYLSSKDPSAATRYDEESHDVDCKKPQLEQCHYTLCVLSVHVLCVCASAACSGLLPRALCWCRMCV